MMKLSLVIWMRAILRLLYLCSLMLITAFMTVSRAWSYTAKSLDVPLHYTVKVISKEYGYVSQTHEIASGVVDDFTWKSQPPAGAVPLDPRCPKINHLALDANHAMLRQINVRLAPVVGLDRVAKLQLSFSAHAPQGSYAYQLETGAKIDCPLDRAHQEIVRFSVPLNGKPRTIVLTDGTKIIVSAKH